MIKIKTQLCDLLMIFFFFFLLSKNRIIWLTCTVLRSDSNLSWLEFPGIPFEETVRSRVSLGRFFRSPCQWLAVLTDPINALNVAFHNLTDTHSAHVHTYTHT